MKFDYSELRARILVKYRTLTNFRKVVGTSYVTLSKKLHNKSYFTQEDVVSWSSLLDIDTEEIGRYFFTICSEN